MTERPPLESMLTSLADSIDWPPPSPDLAEQVRATIEATPAPSAPAWRRRLAVGLAIAVVVSGIVILTPAARQAVADLLGAAGIRIEFGAEEATGVGAGLELGSPSDLDHVGSAVDFEVRAPAGDPPGPPDAVYLTGDGQVSMAWVGTEPLPAAAGTDVALLFGQRAAYGLQDFGEKIVGSSTVVVRLDVEGQPAFWIEGAPHTLTLLDRQGNPVEETARLAANVLLWESGGVNHRLETTGDLAGALAFVDQLEALP